jgi:hypothetical protein
VACAFLEWIPTMTAASFQSSWQTSSYLGCSTMARHQMLDLDGGKTYHGLSELGELSQERAQSAASDSNMGKCVSLRRWHGWHGARATFLSLLEPFQVPTFSSRTRP